MIEPMTKARPPRKNSRSQTSAAATPFSTKPVSEIAWGVRRDSIRRLRTSSRRSPAPIGARARRALARWALRLLRREAACCLGAIGSRLSAARGEAGGRYRREAPHGGAGGGARERARGRGGARARGRGGGGRDGGEGRGGGGGRGPSRTARWPGGRAASAPSSASKMKWLAVTM